MPHFTIESNEDGTVREILKDGQPYHEALVLEQVFGVVTTYFKLAAANIENQKMQQSNEGRRLLGLQAFLMSLTGLEAFTNVYFHLRGLQLNDAGVVARTRRTHGTLSNKLSELIDMVPGNPVLNKDDLISKVFELSQLRNEIVHPRWEPSSVTMESETIDISGLVENRQALFENQQFCREALMWCLLVVARIGEAAGNADSSAFVLYWTGNHNLSLSDILGELAAAP